MEKNEKLIYDQLVKKFKKVDKVLNHYIKSETIDFCAYLKFKCKYAQEVYKQHDN